MATKSVRFPSPPFPIGHSSLESLRQSPLFCSVCLNLSPGSALSSYPRQGLWQRPHLGDWAENAAFVGDADAPPAWTRADARSDYNGWAVAAALEDIVERASAGCSSCAIVKRAVMELGAGKFSGMSIRVYMLFRKGNVLMLRLCRVSDTSPQTDTDFVFAGVLDGPSLSDVLEELAVYELYTLPGRPCPWPTIGSRMSQFLPGLDGFTPAQGYRWHGGTVNHVNPHPLSDQGLRTIQIMMDDCSRNHEFCNKAEALLSRVRRLPKRVVEVGPENNTGIRVFEHAYDIETIKEPYIALSHSWGRTKHPELRHDNFHQRLDNIPYAELPPLYQDAISLTRRFGIHYIWIDSLCIIQGDEADFFDQGAKMALIYEGAQFVLAAASSPNGDTALCTTRSPCVEIAGETEADENFTIFAREACSHHVLGDDNMHSRVSKSVKDCLSSWDVDGTEDPDYHNPVYGNYPLHYRAWCLQERILGSRVLHFARQELVFECLTSLACECGFFAEHQGDPLLESRRAVKSGRKEFGRAQLETDSSIGWKLDRYIPTQSDRDPQRVVSTAEQQSSRHRETWRDLVVQYSQKKLSDPEDGLAAIAGLAERWEDPVTTGRYLSGLWEKDLPSGLRWLPDTREPEGVLSRKFDEHEQKRARKMDRYIAPSWSWASIQRGVAWRDSTVDFDLDTYYVSFDLGPDRTNCEIKDKDFKYGPVSNGYISVTGEIMSIDFEMQDVVFGGGHGGQDKAVILWKNGVYCSPNAVDSLARLEEQPVINDRTTRKGGPLRKLWCLRFCTKPFPVFQGVGIGSEGALLLLEARKEIKERQPIEVQKHEWVFERVGFTYGYKTELWDHEQDSQKVTMYLV